MNLTFPSTLARSLSLLHTTRAGTGRNPAHLVKFTYFLAALLLLALAPPLQAGTPVEQAVFLGGPGGNSGANTNGAGLGISVAVSGETVVVGAPHETVGGVNIGRAYVYVRSGSTWTQQAALQASNAGDGNNDWFGYAVAISGDTIVVGAPREYGDGNDPANNGVTDAGAAYVFTRSGTTWTQQAYLKAGNNRTKLYFGASVAISGGTIAVGTAYSRYIGIFDFGTGGDPSNATGVDGDEYNTDAPSSGAVHVFVRSGQRWQTEAYLKASNTGSPDQFGSALALSGDNLIVGAPFEDSNAAGVNGNQTNNNLFNCGAAYVFTRTNTIWAQQAYLKPEIPLEAQQFGWSVAISGDTAAVGSTQDYGYDFEVNYRTVHVYTRGSGGSWSQQQVLKSNTPTVDKQFGFSVALWNDTLVVGEPIYQGSVHKGFFHVFNRSVAGLWTRQSIVEAADARQGAFAYSLAIEGDVVSVGTGPEGIYSSQGQNKTWIYGNVGQPDIAVEQPPGTALASGGTRSIAAVPGAATDMTFTLKNKGADVLTLTGTPDRGGSSDFTISAQPAATVNGNSSTTFTVHFAPVTAGLQTATLSIPSDDPDESPYLINLTGRGLSFTTDTDGDGVNDATEFQLAGLGFDWQVSQPALMENYQAAANAGRAFDVAGAGNTFTFAETIAGTGGLTKSGDGTLVLTGVASYTGMTNIGAGTLQLGAGLGGAGGPVNVAGGATLLAKGAVARRVGGLGTITADNGPLVLGDLADVNGFNLNGGAGAGGTLNVGGNQVVLLSQAKAVLGAQTNLLTGGTLVTVNGLQLGHAASLDATKILSASGPATLQGDFTNNGVVHGPTGTNQNLVLENFVNGAGSFTGNVVFNGGYSPGNSPATVTLQKVTFAPVNVLTMELGGAVQGSGYDHLNITGSAGLGGAVVVTLVNGFTPAAGDTFDLIDGPTTGSFANLVLPDLPMNQMWDTSQFATNGTIAIIGLNALQTWRRIHFGGIANSGLSADLFDGDQDGLVNLVEFAFGDNPALAGSAHLPPLLKVDGAFRFAFTTPEGVSGISYGAEWSATLQASDWHAIPDTGTPPEHIFTMPAGTSRQMFMRLKITNP